MSILDLESTIPVSPPITKRKIIIIQERFIIKHYIFFVFLAASEADTTKAALEDLEKNLFYYCKTFNLLF